MIEVTRYVANDGKEFTKREECIEYENATELREAIKKISTYCMCTYCEDCLFYKDDCILAHEMPSDW